MCYIVVMEPKRTLTHPPKTVYADDDLWNALQSRLAGQKPKKTISGWFREKAREELLKTDQSNHEGG